ncbi:hypothetical protein EB796_012753 [Bugula neritina]|uniref:Uncharacterized protein n=1 Tax=Bugula neritina TaxID=10212 RepID=A0A7J7JSR2_BUGNE|nr:hypothetical protein EB796_012753 [Bugula neritina]
MFLDSAILMGRRDQIRKCLILTKESPTCWLLWMLAVEQLALLQQAISKAPQVITTKAMIIDEANTDIVYGVPYPRWRGAAVKFEPDTSNFTILRVKVTATGKGPIQPCKMARLFTDVGTIQNGYDNDSKLMIMRAFGVTYPVDETDIVQSDEWIRNNMSSSPPQEREDFEKATREGLAFLLKYEDPLN